MSVSWFRTVGSIASLTALLSAHGLHWGVLQSIAWSRMLIEYAETYGVAQGIRYTFDGEHPCPMCKSIRQARAESAPAHEVANRAAPSDFRFTTPSPAAVAALPPAGREPLGVTAQPPGRPADRPPVPPPRAAA